MAWDKTPRSIEYTDDEKYDRMIGMMGPAMPEPPDYPYGLCLMLAKADLEKAAGEGGAIGDEMSFAAMAEVTSTYEDKDECRIELEVKQLAGADGKFFDLERPAHICLCAPELEKMDLDRDAERGDTIHLIGKACLKSRSDNEYGGETCALQITHLTFEDESAESREG